MNKKGPSHQRPSHVNPSQLEAWRTRSITQPARPSELHHSVLVTLAYPPWTPSPMGQFVRRSTAVNRNRPSGHSGQTNERLEAETSTSCDLISISKISPSRGTHTETGHDSDGGRSAASHRGVTNHDTNAAHPPQSHQIAKFIKIVLKTHQTRKSEHSVVSRLNAPVRQWNSISERIRRTISEMGRRDRTTETNATKDNLKARGGKNQSAILTG